MTLDGFRTKFDPTKKNKPVGSVRQVTAWFRPTIIPGVTAPEDWVAVKLSEGKSGYIERKFLK